MAEEIRGRFKGSLAAYIAAVRAADEAKRKKKEASPVVLQYKRVASPSNLRRDTYDAERNPLVWGQPDYSNPLISRNPTSPSRPYAPREDFPVRRGHWSFNIGAAMRPNKSVFRPSFALPKSKWWRRSI